MCTHRASKLIKHRGHKSCDPAAVPSELLSFRIASPDEWNCFLDIDDQIEQLFYLVSYIYLIIKLTKIL